MLASSLLTLVLAAVSANAHSILGQVIVDGKPQGVKTGIRMPKNNSPVLKVDSDAIECNANTKPASDIIAVKSGSEIGIEWHRNPGQAGSDVISKSHRGPIEVYLAKISDAKQANVSSLGWFKISEQGYDINSDTWATDDLIKNKGVYNFKIPECIAEGDYLMRGSIIALHNADKPAEGAQHYMECAQISVSGTTGAKSPDTVSFPGAYKSDDPGLTFNIYKGKKAYPIPGPEVFTCDGSGNENTTATSATETATTTDAEDADETGTSTDGYEDNQTTDTDNATATSTTAASAKTSGACRAKRGHSRRH